jgi:hypothetical protein
MQAGEFAGLPINLGNELATEKTRTGCTSGLQFSLPFLPLRTKNNKQETESNFGERHNHGLNYRAV